MTRRRHTSLTLRQQLDGVNALLKNGRATDAGVAAQLPTQLGHLRGALEREKLPEWLPACTLAVRLAEAVSEGRTLGPDDLLALIDSIAAEMSQAFGVERTASEPAPRAATPSDPDQPGLQLLSARRLGEIMVQMSMLKPSDVERALRHQKASGCRLGEALIQLGILDKDAVQSALRLQELRSRSLRSTWGLSA